MQFEYKIVPAPRTPNKVRGVRGSEARFAFTLEETINVTAREGWEFVRAESLPCEHRGWFSRRTETHALLVFRRGKGEVVEDLPEMPSRVRAPSEPRLAAERGARPRTSFSSLRSAPAPAQGPDDTRG